MNLVPEYYGTHTITTSEFYLEILGYDRATSPMVKWVLFRKWTELGLKSTLTKALTIFLKNVILQWYFLKNIFE